VEIPEVANLFKKISVEFVKKYPTIDAVQWDDYLGYHADLPGKVDRTTRLTNFVRQMRADIKKANPKLVSTFVIIILIGVNVILPLIGKIGMWIEFSFKLITMLILTKS
jgi:uncharacterized lipoprotein YddW (UPF0748 family)